MAYSPEQLAQFSALAASDPQAAYQYGSSLGASAADMAGYVNNNLGGNVTANQIQNDYGSPRVSSGGNPAQPVGGGVQDWMKQRGYGSLGADGNWQWNNDLANAFSKNNGVNYYNEAAGRAIGDMFGTAQGAGWKPSQLTSELGKLGVDPNTVNQLGWNGVRTGGDLYSSIGGPGANSTLIGQQGLRFGFNGRADNPTDTWDTQSVGNLGWNGSIINGNINGGGAGSQGASNQAGNGLANNPGATGGASAGAVTGATSSNLGLGSMPGYNPVTANGNPYGGAGNNPYLEQMGNSIMDMQNRNLNLNVMPSIRSGAMGAGQYGSSRQGIAEGVASGMADQNTRQALSNLYGTSYETAQNRDLQGQMANSNNYGNMYQFNQNLARNVNNDNWNRQMQGIGLANQSYNLGLGASQTGNQIGNQIYNRPWQTLQNSTNIGSAIGGQGRMSNSSMNSNGNGMAGAMGGAAAGYGLGQQFGGMFGGGGGGGDNPLGFLGNGITGSMFGG